MESGKKQQHECQRDQLEQEMWKAHREWELAQKRLDHALGNDEVDYAIFMLEATEKRYNMLLRKLKEMHAEEAQQLAGLDLKPQQPGFRLRFWKEGKWWHKDGSSS